ncbi:MAG: acetyl-CoA carboxylase, carboxyltransferase subunit beta [Croceibacterium sp.]
MSWLSKVRNSLSFTKKRESPDDLWVKCPRCHDMLFSREYEANLYVCPRCEYHGRIGADTRLAQILDDGYRLLADPVVREDPLKFRDTKKYTDRLKQARAANPHCDAFTAALGTLAGHPAVVGVQDFNFLTGSMGLAVGQAFCDGAQAALDAKCGYIVCTSGGGARMQEGILSLMQMPRATVMTRRLKDAGLPYIVVLTDPTTGGITASYAMLGDVHLAEPDALIGFAGQRVIQETIRAQLPEGFQRAEYLQRHGMVDMVVHRKDLRDTLAKLLGYLAPAQAA